MAAANQSSSLSLHEDSQMMTYMDSIEEISAVNMMQIEPRSMATVEKSSNMGRLFNLTKNNLPTSPKKEAAAPEKQTALSPKRQKVSGSKKPNTSLQSYLVRQ